MGSLIATHAGLRGRPGIDLTPEVVAHAVGGLAALLHDRGLPPEIALARDARPSGAALARHATEAALASGLDVVDLGVASTPATKRFLSRGGLGGAVVVTGSHLAHDLNGLKLVAGDPPCPVDPRALPPPRPATRTGAVTAQTGAMGAHVADVVASVDAEAIRAAGLRATGRGGVGDAGAQLLVALGVAPGAGPRFVLDDDADRLAIDGLAPDSVLLLAATALRPAVLVKGADTSRAVDVLAGETVVVAPGELHLIEAMRRTGATLAGEGNGGVVRAGLASGRDGLGAMALILELIARDARAIADVPAVHIARAARQLDDAHGRAAGLPGAVDLGPERGVVLERGSGAWALVRASATEHVARVTAEASSAAAAAELLDEVLAELAT